MGSFLVAISMSMGSTSHARSACMVWLFDQSGLYGFLDCSCHQTYKLSLQVQLHFCFYEEYGHFCEHCDRRTDKRFQGQSCLCLRGMAWVRGTLGQHVWRGLGGKVCRKILDCSCHQTYKLSLQVQQPFYITYKPTSWATAMKIMITVSGCQCPQQA